MVFSISISLDLELKMRTLNYIVFFSYVTRFCRGEVSGSKCSLRGIEKESVVGWLKIHREDTCPSLPTKFLLFFSSFPMLSHMKMEVGLFMEISWALLLLVKCLRCALNHLVSDSYQFL